MDCIKEHNSALVDELLEAQAYVWNDLFGFITSMSLKCAAQLGVFDAIKNHEGANPITLDGLVTSLQIHPSKTPFVRRLVHILARSGYVSTQNVSKSQDQEGYALTNRSKLLLKDNPLSARPFLLAMLDPVLTNPWDQLATWFQSSELIDDHVSVFNFVNGKTFWENCGEIQRLNGFFNEAMASDARLVGSVLVNSGRFKGVFEGLVSLVDVGGGTGTLAKAISEAFPLLDCVVLDLPHVVDGKQDSGNLKFVGGDMLVHVPPAHAVLLKWILHDWNDEGCVAILKRCKEAIEGKEGGKVIIIDMVVKNEGKTESIETQLYFDMLMMVLTSGLERNETEWAKLFREAGFSNYKIFPILGLRSLIEVYP